jgi:hypothetical protein
LQRDDLDHAGREGYLWPLVGGLLVTGTVDNNHWRELVAQFYGFLPPNDEDSKKINKQLNPI